MKFSSISFLSFLYYAMCYQSPHRTIAASIRDMTNIQIPYKTINPSNTAIAFEDGPLSNTVDGYDNRCSNSTEANQTEIQTLQRIFYLAKRLFQLQYGIMTTEQRETLAKQILDDEAEAKQGRSKMALNIRNGGLFGGLYEDDEWHLL